MFCRARWGQAVVLPGGPAGDRALVLLREAVPAEAPEEGVDSALLGVGEAVVELPEELIAVLVSPAEDLEQAELQKVLLQHRDTPVPARPRTVRRAQ